MISDALSKRVVATYMQSVYANTTISADALESITERYTRQFAINDSWVRDEVKRIVSADADTLFSYSVKAGHCYSVPLMKATSMASNIGIKEDTARRDDARFYRDPEAVLEEWYTHCLHTYGRGIAGLGLYALVSEAVVVNGVTLYKTRSGLVLPLTELNTDSNDSYVSLRTGRVYKYTNYEDYFKVEVARTTVTLDNLRNEGSALKVICESKDDLWSVLNASCEYEDGVLAKVLYRILSKLEGSSSMKVRVMVATNPEVRDRMLRREFNDLVWASDDMETVAHYYEGAVVEMQVDLCSKVEMQYVRDASELVVPVGEYTFGVAEMHYPPGAYWYVFSRAYLLEHATDIREVFPNLEQYMEHDDE